ncbi:MAG: tRNA (adenosine(37)-N6)-dimethylallyltransferase MiaA [Burkholderiaceae bacterium]
MTDAPESSQREGPLILLLGPTASGKSAIAMALAERFEIEIISVDSGQIYRRLDLGSAKPAAEERARVPHHLIDIIDPWDSYSAARFAADARRTIGEIRARARLPLLVGGTMLYARALTDGLHELPAADPALRAQLLARASRDGWPAMHAWLATLDPVTAARLARNDAQRIERALEVCLISGRPMSALLAQPAARAWHGPVLRISLEPDDRSLLHARIAERFTAMIAAGLIDEVRALRADPRLHAHLPAMRSVGYRQVWQWLDDGGRETRDILIARGVAATRQLAKRQLTWLRAIDDRARIAMESASGTDRIAELIARQLDP